VLLVRSDGGARQPNSRKQSNTVIQTQFFSGKRQTRLEVVAVPHVVAPTIARTPSAATILAWSRTHKGGWSAWCDPHALKRVRLLATTFDSHTSMSCSCTIMAQWDSDDDAHRFGVHVFQPFCNGGLELAIRHAHSDPPEQTNVNQVLCLGNGPSNGCAKLFACGDRCWSNWARVPQARRVKKLELCCQTTAVKVTPSHSRPVGVLAQSLDHLSSTVAEAPQKGYSSTTTPPKTPTVTLFECGERSQLAKRQDGPDALHGHPAAMPAAPPPTSHTLQPQVGCCRSLNVAEAAHQNTLKRSMSSCPPQLQCPALQRPFHVDTTLHPQPGQSGCARVCAVDSLSEWRASSCWTSDAASPRLGASAQSRQRGEVLRFWRPARCLQAQKRVASSFVVVAAQAKASSFFQLSV